MQNLIACQKTDLQPEYEKQTIFQYVRVRAAQNTIKRTTRIHKKRNRKSDRTKNRKIIKKGNPDHEQIIKK